MFFDKMGSDDWRIRRRIIIMLLLWLVGLITYITIYGPPDQLREAIATSGMILIGSIVGSYVFGVIWENKGRQAMTTTEMRATVVQPTETDPAPQQQPAQPAQPQGPLD